MESIMIYIRLNDMLNALYFIQGLFALNACHLLKRKLRQDVYDEFTLRDQASSVTITSKKVILPKNFAEKLSSELQ